MNDFRDKKVLARKAAAGLLTLLVGAIVGTFILILPSSNAEGRDDTPKHNGDNRQPSGVSPVASYSGMCAASAAVALGPELFIVASDEDNILRVYSTAESSVVSTFELSKYFKAAIKDAVGLDDPEKVDIEGATKLGDYIFWIGSHSAAKSKEDDPKSIKGDPRPARCRLFAHALKSTAQGLTLDAIGKPYESFLQDITKDHRYDKYDLGEASQRRSKAPGALSIEGLSSTRDGELLIGFRNPVPRNKALIVPLRNPIEVVKGNKPAAFGDPIELDLGGFGIRDMAWWAGGNVYFIVAGPFGKNVNKESFRLYQWSGQPGRTPEEIKTDKLGGLNAEAVVVYPSSDPTRVRLQILSDDEKDGHCGPSNSFRSVWIDFQK